LARAPADLAELKAAKERGQLLDAAEVEAAWSGVLRTVRAACPNPGTKRPACPFGAPAQ